MSWLLSITLTSDSMPISPSHSWKNSMMVWDRSSSVRANSRRVPIALPSGIVRSPSEPTS